jgi:hypothetical protein
MGIAGAIAMPFAIFGFLMGMYALRRIGALEKQIEKLTNS